jgi:hypothetical protein
MKLIFSIILLLFNWSLIAQEDFLIPEEKVEKFKFTDQLVLDFNFLLQFGNPSLLGGNPQLGYQLTPQAIVGGGYNYAAQTIRFQSGARSRDLLLGPTAYLSVKVLQDYFIRSDFQWLTIQADNGTVIPSEFPLNRWLVGAGYRSLISDKFAFSSGIYLDINAPIILPLFRTGIEYNFGRWY